MFCAYVAWLVCRLISMWLGCVISSHCRPVSPKRACPGQSHSWLLWATCGLQAIHFEPRPSRLYILVGECQAYSVIVKFDLFLLYSYHCKSVKNWCIFRIVNFSTHVDPKICEMLVLCVLFRLLYLAEKTGLSVMNLLSLGTSQWANVGETCRW